ncbi:alpha-amylase [Pseudomonas sp. LPB0260]|uniref:alpha-amylase n=1 Tax=Pseudomonas sp. LPB0260 TaxID=2614442 RepID=UPI0021158AF3|nr:alpha-amylase [Pseudomonas sp. LPB0260]
MLTILLLPGRVALAAPPVQAWLDQQAVALDWQTDGRQRFSSELELAPGLLVLQGPAGSAAAQALAPYQRHPWREDSHLSLTLATAGRYRLLFQGGDAPSLRLLPVKQAARPTRCASWQGEALEVDVSRVFADGQLLRDAYSGQQARVEHGRVSLKPSAQSGGLLLLEAAEADAPASHDWRNATVYFVLTDRFANGDPGNDRSYGRQPDGEQEIGTFHGGDLKGLTGKLDYLQQLGVSALWLSAPYEQIHGWVGGGDQGDFRHYAYHGYYALDYTQLDANMGREDELRELIRQAHARGIRVLFDVVLNHPGYSTLADMQALDFGALRGGMSKFLPNDWSAWRPEPFENLHAYHNLIDYQHPNWAAWWGKDWVRAGIADYDSPPSVLADPLKGSLAFLPDFKTDSQQAVALPAFLKRKQPTRAVERAGYRVRDYLAEWLSFWVREFGVDGFRADTVKHVDLASWAELRRAADQARAEWSANNPHDPMSGTPFWMVGEVFGHGPQPNSYQANGFDGLINFAFQHDSAGPASECLAQADSTYRDYAALLSDNPAHNFMSYASSHDTSLFFASQGHSLARQRGLASALLLSPGAVQLYYGDESARRLGPSGSDPQQGTRSAMNWSEHEQPEIAALIRHWQLLGQFRARHPAIGAGRHQRLPGQAYAFSRQLGADKVVVVQGP